MGEKKLPDSLYLPGKPAWWLDGLAWPPFGPDGSTADNKIPAQVRFLAQPPVAHRPGPDGEAGVQQDGGRLP